MYSCRGGKAVSKKRRKIAVGDQKVLQATEDEATRVLEKRVTRVRSKPAEQLQHFRMQGIPFSKFKRRCVDHLFTHIFSQRT